MRHNLGAAWSAWFILLKFYGRSIGYVKIEFCPKCCQTLPVEDIYYMEYLDYIASSEE
jgi:hypothetical protein